jgi:hypothetical protein
MTSRTNLPDTPLNRRLIRRLADQDARGRALQRSLFHETSEADEPTTPPPTDPTVYATSTATFKLQADDDLIDGEPIPNPNAADGLIISKMISGASSHRVVSSEDIYKTLVAQINIKSEFFQSYEQKKNRSVSVFAFVNHIKSSEKYFQWPASQEGDALRDVLFDLATNLTAEYSAPPKLVAVIQIVSLVLSSHKLCVLTDFHSAVCVSDIDFAEFETKCTMGESAGCKLQFVHPTLLPGYQRLVGSHSAEWWVATATAIIDSVCFMNIQGLEADSVLKTKAWRQFAVGSKAPKLAMAEEHSLFAALVAAANRASLSVIDEIERGQLILKGITCSVNLQGRAVTVQSLIRDEITRQKLGKAAVKPDWIFQQYKEFYDFGLHQLPEPTSNQHSDKLIVCQDCTVQFTFTAAEQRFYKSRNMSSDRLRCEPCNTKNKAAMANKQCPQFARGACKSGDSCRMAHGMVASPPPSQSAQHSPTILATQVNNNATAAVSANCASCENKFEYDAAFYEERKLHMPKNCKGCILLKKQRRAAAEATVMTLVSAEDEYPGRRPAYFCDDDHTDSDDY